MLPTPLKKSASPERDAIIRQMLDDLERLARECEARGYRLAANLAGSAAFALKERG